MRVTLSLASIQSQELATPSILLQSLSSISHVLSISQPTCQSSSHSNWQLPIDESTANDNRNKQWEMATLAQFDSHRQPQTPQQQQHNNNGNKNQNRNRNDKRNRSLVKCSSSSTKIEWHLFSSWHDKLKQETALKYVVSPCALSLRRGAYAEDQRPNRMRRGRLRRLWCRRTRTLLSLIHHRPSRSPPPPAQ